MKPSVKDVKKIRKIANEWDLDFKQAKESLGINMGFDFLETIAKNSDTTKWNMDAFILLVVKNSHHFMPDIREEAKIVMKILRKNGVM